MPDPLARLRIDQNVYEDDAGTDACEDADNIANWGFASDSTESGAAVQTVDGRRPSYVADDGGHPAARFQFETLRIPHSAPWVLTAFHVFCVVKVDSAAVFDHLWGTSAGWTSSGCGIRCVTDNYVTRKHFICYVDPGAADMGAILTTPEGKYFVLSFGSDGSDLRVGINEQTIFRMPASAISWGTSDKVIGAPTDATAYAVADASFREWVCFGSLLSEEDAATEISSLMSRWGITNEIDPPASGGGVGSPNLKRTLQRLEGVGING